MFNKDHVKMTGWKEVEINDIEYLECYLFVSTTGMTGTGICSASVLMEDIKDNNIDILKKETIEGSYLSLDSLIEYNKTESIEMTDKTKEDMKRFCAKNEWPTC